MSAPAEPDAHGPSLVVAAVLVLVAGAAQVGLGLGAIGGVDAFEDNVFEIESNEDFGELYLSLSTWGAIAVLLGLAELAGGVALLRRVANARLAALVVAYAGLAGAFFTLAIFRGMSLAVIAIQLVAIFLLSYYGGRPWCGRR